MKWLFLAVGVVFLGVLASPNSARAQNPTITLSTPIERTGPQRDVGREPFWVSRNDCLTENNIVFPVNLTNMAGLFLEVWAGSANCADQTVRTNLTCREIKGAARTSLQDFISVEVPARELAIAAFPDPNMEEPCTGTQTLPNPQPTTLYFLLLDAAGGPARASQTYATAVDLLGPEPPTNVTAGVGENQLIARWQATTSTADKVSGYRIYCEALSGAAAESCTPEALVPGELPPEGLSCGSVSDQIAQSGSARGLENGVVYAVGASSVDLVENTGKLSTVSCGSPALVTDFYELYREQGGQAGGGFCTFASGPGRGRAVPGLMLVAALVLLRRRRTKLVQGRVTGSPSRRSGLVAKRVRRTLHRHGGLLAALLASASFLGPNEAKAQSGFGGGVRYDTDTGGTVPLRYPGRQLYELRIGPYRPSIDDQFPAPGPYRSVFGKRTRILVGLEVDWQVLEVPGILNLGPGFGFGLTQMSGEAPLADGTGRSSQENTLTILPFHLLGVLRLTALDDQLSVPLVPYAKAGLGYALWWSTSGDRLSRYQGDVGRGSSIGPQWSLGVMLDLGFFDRQAERDMSRGIDMTKAFLFGEWLNSDLSGFGSNDLRVGTESWFVGLALQD